MAYHSPMTTEAATSEQDRAELMIRHARPGDLARINDIYNHYVRETPITFDLVETPLSDREAWFERFAEQGRQQLFVAEEGGVVLGCAYSYRFRDRAAYDTTIETTVYCDAAATGRGLGTALYDTLFAAIANENVHIAIAGITLPNPASVALHERFGFQLVGVTHEVGYKFGRYWDVAWYERRLA